MESVGKIEFAVPFPAMCWQSLHQQILVTTGSPVTRYLIFPHRHRPIRVFMGLCVEVFVAEGRGR